MVDATQGHAVPSQIIRKTIPNFFTVGSIVCGLASLLLVRDQYFSLAAFLVVVAMLLDSLDGRTARLIKGMSDFGAQMDSLADMVSFGVVPAFTVVLALYKELADPRYSFAIGCGYAVAVAIRLARFNCRIGVSDKNYFEGLPCPAAAGLVMLMISILLSQGIAYRYVAPSLARGIMMSVTILVSVLMVSNIPFYNFKHVHWTRLKLLWLLLVVVAIGGYILLPWGNWLATVLKVTIVITGGLAFYIVGALFSWPVRCYIKMYYVPKDS